MIVKASNRTNYLSTAHTQANIPYKAMAINAHKNKIISSTYTQISKTKTKDYILYRKQMHAC